MKRVYIAGPYSSDNVLGVLDNVRAGMRMATKLLQHGFAVFCPWTDHQLFFQLREGESISIETIQAHSMEWLKVSDAVLVLKGFEASRGTLEEMRVAYSLDKPVYFNPCELYQWAEKEKASESQGT
jgi:nucleoside 2-deoxyribosyltransferase